MVIYLVQHAEAKSREEDAERGLSEKGFQDIQRVATFLQDRIGADRILYSTKKRARQTAEILADTLNIEYVEEAPDLDPMADPGVWSARLASMTEDVMLVGHLPHMERLASLLLAGNPEQSVVLYKPGTVLCLERGEGGWHVKWMLPPCLVA